MKLMAAKRLLQDYLLVYSMDVHAGVFVGGSQQCEIGMRGQPRRSLIVGHLLHAAFQNNNVANTRSCCLWVRLSCLANFQPWPTQVYAHTTTIAFNHCQRG